MFYTLYYNLPKIATITYFNFLDCLSVFCVAIESYEKSKLKKTNKEFMKTTFSFASQ